MHSNEEELEKILARIKKEVELVLPEVKDPKVKKALEGIVKLSTFKRVCVEDGAEGYKFAMKRADLKAEERGEVFVVAEEGSASRIIVCSKARLLKDSPYGLKEKNIIYSTDGKVNRITPFATA
jgi:hypothetical protein